MAAGRRRWLSGPKAVLLTIGVVVVALVIAASTVTRADDSPSSPAAAESSAGQVRVVYGDPNVPTSVLASRELFSSAPTVVVTPTPTAAAADVAKRLRAPMFVVDAAGLDAVRAELQRLRTTSVVEPSGSPTPPVALDIVAESEAQQGVSRVSTSGQVVLVPTADVAALATAAAAGAVGAVAENGNPRTSSAALDALKSARTAPVVGLGGEFGTATLLSQRVDDARAAPELPGGGVTVFPGRRLVALYGSPGSAALGPLGRQSLPAAIARAKRVAAEYESVSSAQVVPAFEIIVTVASASPGPGNNYTSIIDPAVIRPWVEAAGRAGVYVTLDLQPGRMDFLRQAKMYTDLLTLPHVGLALDSEWRLKPNQVHLTQIGSVGAAEVNRTAAWLADLVRTHNLPQKVLVLHQFDSDMLANRKAIITSRPELAVVIHADGHGTPPVKMATWRRLVTGLPPNVWMGWKNFYTEDHPTFTPAQTMRVSPAPWFVSYQ